MGSRVSSCRSEVVELQINLCTEVASMKASDLCSQSAFPFLACAGKWVLSPSLPPKRKEGHIHESGSWKK